ncbi:MAG: hypothetical protein WED82_06300, partial [Balneolales bacterium]
WIEYCVLNNIVFKVVNCFDSDIIDQLKDCEGLMWHWTLSDHKAVLFARQLTYSLKKAGIKVFPDESTCWHYDDKVGQKYLLEAINAPLVPSHIFYDKKKALDWISRTKFPKVFKTRNGAASRNVRLIQNKSVARKIVNKSFGKGIPGYDKVNEFKESLWKYKTNKGLKSFGRVCKYFFMLPLPKRFQPEYTNEKNYVYFQDFIPDNGYDIRVVIIRNRAFGIRRYVRDNDFRASGSGKIEHFRESIPLTCIKKAFKLSKKIGSQSIAFDFIYSGNKPLIVEISYAFAQKVYIECPGYWDRQLQWHEERFHPEYFMIQDMLTEIESESITEASNLNKNSGNLAYS